MSVLYDPQKRKTRVWVPVLFVLIPIILIVLLFMIGGNVAKNAEPEPKKSQLR